VGSFDVRQDADALAQQLEQHGYSTSVTKGAPYRVWVGGYLDRATANQLVSALRQIGVAATTVP
jgi:cell division protein FtsN